MYIPHFSHLLDFFLSLLFAMFFTFRALALLWTVKDTSIHCQVFQSWSTLKVERNWTILYNQTIIIATSYIRLGWRFWSSYACDMCVPRYTTPLLQYWCSSAFSSMLDKELARYASTIWFAGIAMSTAMSTVMKSYHRRRNHGGPPKTFNRGPENWHHKVSD